MKISEAVEKALTEGRCITPKEHEGWIKIKPTNDAAQGNCILMGADGSNPSKHGWQPSADDLMRDDWIVVD